MQGYRVSEEPLFDKEKPRLHHGTRAFRGLSGLDTTHKNISLAEQAGFEPAEGLTPRTLSRRVT